MRRNYNRFEDYISSQMLLWTRNHYNNKPHVDADDVPPVVSQSGLFVRNKRGLFIALNGALAMTGLVSLWLQRKDKLHTKATIKRGVDDAWTHDHVKQERYQKYLELSTRQQKEIDSLKTEQMVALEKLVLKRADLAQQKANFEARTNVLHDEKRALLRSMYEDKARYEYELTQRLSSQFAHDTAQLQAQFDEKTTLHHSQMQNLERTLLQQTQALERSAADFDQTLQQLEHKLAVQTHALEQAQTKLARSKAVFDEEKTLYHMQMQELERKLDMQTQALEQAQGELARSKINFDDTVHALAQHHEDIIADLEHTHSLTKAAALQASRDRHQRDLDNLLAKQSEYTTTIAEMHQKHELALHQQAQELTKPQDHKPIIVPYQRQIRNLTQTIQQKEQTLIAIRAAKDLVDQENTRLRAELRAHH